MQVVLVMFRSDGERRSFSVVRNMTVVGRREDCDLRIPVGDVSRKHCRLVRTDDGIRIEDLGSSNGTYVNGERIQESELAAGDVLGIGPVQFIVQIDGIPADEELQPPAAQQPAEVAPEPPAEELTELEELPAEEEFALEEEPVAIEEELAPVAEHPGEEPEEYATEQHTPLDLDDDSMTSLAEIPTDEHLGDEEFLTEEEPLEDDALAPVEGAVVEHSPAEDVLAEEPIEEIEESHHQETAEPPAQPQVAAEAVPLDDFEELNLDEIPLEEAEETAPAATTPQNAAPAPEPVPAVTAESDFEELELEEEHPALNEEPLDEEPLALDATTQSVAVEPPPAPVADHLDGELELEEFDLAEPVETPANPALSVEEPTAVKVEPAPLELATAEPAYDEVSIEGGADEFEELTLDEAPAAEAEAGESTWDFVIEEADSTRSHHDFKLDLDSPHEQTHG